VATAHLIALTVHRLTGLPWVADFRDPMVQEGQPTSRLNRMAYLRLEKAVVSRAASCTLVTHSALDDYRRRYPDKDPSSWQVIENGYDESLFAPFAHLSDAGRERVVGQPVRMLHSGLLYGTGRNSLPFLQAVKALIEQDGINIEVVFRGSGNEAEVGEQIKRLNLAHVVKLLPPIAYDEAIREMLEADVLLVFQGAVFNKQIPAKIYEYIRAGRSILAMTDKGGDTTRFLGDWDGTYIADIESSAIIEEKMKIILNDIKSLKKLNRDILSVACLSRFEKSKALALLLNKKLQSKNLSS